MTARHLLQQKIKSGKAQVAVIGLGYVGLPLAVGFAERGVSVTGIDMDSKKVRQVQAGKSYIRDISASRVRAAVKKGRLRATSDSHALRVMDAVIVCVPTPLNRVKDPDLSYIIHAADSIAKHLRRGQLIILESTTYPGTTDEVLLPKLERKGLKAGRDFFLCFSPERIDPGNKRFPLSEIPKVVGGITPACTDLAAALYGRIFSKVVRVSSARTAEMTKLLENTFRIVNIGLINELAMIAGALGVNIWESIDAAKTKPFGYMPFYPGPGVGGHCIGIDPIYLSWKAKTHGLNIRFIDLARDVNSNMPRYVVQRIQRELATRQKKAIRGAKILILGITYKRDVEDTRESPAFEIIEELHQLGARVAYHDPFVPSVQFDAISLKSRPLTPQEIKRHDLAVIVTDHSGIRYDLLRKHARLILDTRHVIKNASINQVAML